MKRTVVIVLLLAIAVAVGVWWVTERLDGVVAAAIEETGTQLLGSRVSVSGVEIDLTGGSASILGLRVANPRGEGLAFSSDPAFILAEITVAIDLERLDLQDIGAAPLPLTLVLVGQPTVNAEVTATGINLDVLRRNVGSAGPSEAAAESGGDPVRLQIDRFEFADGSLRADTSAVGGDVREVELPPLRLSNLRGTPDEVGKRVLDAFLAAAVRQVARDQLSSEVEEQLEGVKEKAADAFRSLLGVEEKE